MLVQPWSMFKMLVTDAGNSVRRAGVRFMVVITALACGVSYAQSLAKLPRLASATRTVLNSTAEDTAAGERVTFTARVSNSTGGAVHGAVLFCRAANPVCSGPSVVAEAQLKSDGTATMTKVFGPGNYAIVARYDGTKSASPSTSNVVTGSVTGQTATVTAIAYRKQQGAVAIGSTVSAFGTVTPTGSVSLLDMANGGVSIGSAPLVSSSVYQSFQKASSLQSSGQTTKIVSADFNGDGVQDAAVLEPGSGKVEVLLGLGDGTLAMGSEIAVGADAVDLATGDFNDDGAVDLVVARPASMQVFRGNGDGSFQAQLPVSLSIAPLGIAVADLDRDGELDVVVMSKLGEVQTWTGAGDGTFNFARTVSTGSVPASFAVSDFNGDAAADLVVADVSQNQLLLLTNDGQGGFGSPKRIALPQGTAAGAMVAADLRNTGNADLIVLDAIASKALYLMNDGSGSLKSATQISLPFAGGSVAAADLNGDGLFDLVVSSPPAGTVALAGSGDGTFRAAAKVSGVGSSALATADLNGDGLADLLSPGNGTVDTLLSQTTIAAQSTMAVLDAGAHQIVAAYSGDTAHAPSRSQAISLNMTISGLMASANLAPRPLIPLGSVTIAPTFGTALYVDTKASPYPTGNYAGYTITNGTGADIADLWVKLGSFTGGKIGLGGSDNGVAHLGKLTAGASKAVYFYLSLDCSAYSAGGCNSMPAQGFTVTAYSGPPSTSPLASYTSSGLTVVETTAANANKITSGTVSTTTPSLGTTLAVTINGQAGTIGSADIFYLAPQISSSFPAGSLRLISTAVTFTGVSTISDQLLLSPSTIGGLTNTDYTATYTYLVTGTTSTSTPVAPLAYISSGTQVKHTDTTSLASVPAINPISNTLLLSISASPDTLATAGNVTYTVHATNSGAAAASLDQLISVLATTPDNASYVAGTSTFAGNPISDPVANGSTLTWSGSFTVPANGSADLTFQVSLPSTVGSYLTSVYGLIGSTQVDSTISTADNAPATATVTIGLVNTTTALSANPSSPVYNSSVTLTAVVTPTPTGSPLGTVSFYNGATLLGQGTVDGTGTATLSTSSLATGNATITASYSGNTTFGSSVSSPLSLTIGKATATVNLSNLAQTYTGSALTVTTGTQPSGLSVDCTYNSSSTAPTAAGSYAVVCTVNDPNYSGSATGTLVISPATATVTLGNLSQTYTGSPLSATATTQPSGLSVTLTYDASSTAPTAAGSYTVVGTISDPNYTGTITGTLVISPAAATVSLGSLNQTYTGSPLPVTATTQPSGLSVTFTYNASGTAPTAAGSYTVVGTVNDPNYTGSATGTLVIAKATAPVTLGNLNQTYTGSPLSATATTQPSGLSVALTYNSSATAPTAAGSYAVVGTINDPNYTGSATGTLVIAKASIPVTLGNLVQNYTGSGVAVSVTTVPAGLAVDVTYDNSPTLPVAAGSYAVSATVNDPNYTGSTTGTLVVNKAQASINIGNLNQVYTGSGVSVSTSTTPAGLTVNCTYNSSATLPVAAGTYAVVCTISDGNYSGTATATLQIGKASATVNLGGLQQTYSGQPLPVSTTTAPGSLSVTVTYGGSQSAPVHAGSYAVSATINDPNYQGSTTGTLVIAKAVPVIAWAAPAPIAYGTTLSGTQLNASVNGVAGTFTYNPVAGTILSPGTAETLSVTFTPNDSTDYVSVNQSVTIDVLQEAAVASLTTDADPAMLKTAVDFTATVSSTTGVPTGSVTFLDGTTPIGTAVLSGGVARFTTSSLSAGKHSISAVYDGTAGFTGASSSPLQENILDFNLSAASAQSGGTTGTVLGDKSALFAVTIAPTNGTVFPVSTVLTVTGVPSNVETTLNSQGWTQVSANSWTLPASASLADVSLSFQSVKQASAAHEPAMPSQLSGKALLPIALGLLVLPFRRRMRAVAEMLRGKSAWMVLIAVGLLSIAGMTGCGSTNGFFNGTRHDVTVTVTTGSLSHSTHITLETE